MMWEYGMGWGWGWFGMILFWLVPILFIAVVLKYFFAGDSRRNPASRDARRGALDVLEERYARGEIDREEFLKKRDDLKRG